MSRLIFLILTLYSFTFSQDRSTDSLALVAIYNATDGENWNSPWNLNEEMGNWSGVSFSGNRVFQLNIAGQGLDGTIPADIGDLTELTYLYLSTNSNITSLPNEIGRLSNLQYLDVANMGLTSLPDSIGNLENVTTLQAYSNQLTTLPDSIVSMTNLTTVYLRSNNLTSLPDGMDKLKNLSTLRVYSNNLTSLPESIGQMTNLNTLFVYNNQLTSFISDVSGLVNLTNLNMRNNSISDLTFDGSDLISLTSISIDDNNFTEIPSAVLDITSLNYLYADNNAISTVPSSIENLTSLQTLDLSYNDISSLPSEFSNLSNLDDFYLSNNSFSSIPSEIFDLNTLEGLDLSSNGLTSIPNEIGRLTLLSFLSFNSNEIEIIPDSVERLTSLEQLSLSTNKISEVPDFIDDLDLSTLDLSNNNLTSFPDLSSSTNLNYLYLQENQIEGTMPDHYGNFTDMYNFYISDNNIDSLPNLDGSAIDGVVNYFYFYRNNLGFASLINNVNIGEYSTIYHTQGDFGDGIDTVMGLSQSITLEAKYDHPDNTIQWYKEDIAIDGETSSSLIITTNSLDDAGRYNYVYQNPDANVSSFQIKSKDFLIKIPDTEAPPPPSSFNTNPRNASIYITWNTNPENEYDFAYYHIIDANEDTVIMSFPAGTNSYTLTGLTNGVAYSLVMRSEDVFGNLSTESSLSTSIPDGDPPAKVENLQIEVRDRAVNLTWDNIEGESGLSYWIYYGLSENNLSQYTLTGSTSYHFTGLSNDVEYFFKISAQDAAQNEGEQSDLGSATPLNIAPPLPYDVVVKENDMTLIVEFDIEYDIPDFQHYVLYMDTETDPTTPVDTLTTQYNSGNSNLKFELSNLTNETEYFFRIQTIDQSEQFSGYSLNASGIPDTYRMTDSLALVALYNALDGPNWSNQTNWLTGTINTWSGITVENDRVTRIDLYNRNLDGTVPSDIGDLTGLIYFRIGNDNVSDSIPSEIGNLKNLETLYLYNNQITSLPKKIGQLIKLTYFNAYNNQISSIPDEFGDMEMLESIFLGENNLTSFPDVLSGMSNLSNVSLYSNQLTSFNISLPSTIIELDVSNNELNSFPSQISDATSLQYFYLYSNNITDIDVDYSGLGNLSELDLGNNEIATIPAGISDLTNLERIYLNDNNLLTLPEEFYELTKLIYLDLDGNSLSSLSSSIEDFTLLATIDLEDNNFSDLPNEFANLSSIQTVYLDHNNFTEIPTELFSLSTLTRLEISNNDLTSFNSDMQNMSNLQILQLNNNQINDSIPSEFGNLSSLREFDAYNNQIFGAIPKALANIPQLDRINFNNNKLNEPLPEELGNAPLLRYIYVNNNEIPGNIPSSFASATSLIYIEIYSNKLSGTLNPDLGNSTTLQRLYVHDNNIDSIPDYTGTNLDGVLLWFNIYDNNLDFDDIIPNLNVPQYGLSYSNMKPSTEDEIIEVALESDITLTATTSHEDDQIQWYFNNNVISGATESTYEVENIDEDDSGIYTYRITNTNASNLTIHSGEFKVLIPDDIPPQIPQSYSIAPRNGQAFLNWGSNNESDFKHFLIYDANPSKNGGVLVDSTTNTNYTIEGLINGSTYSYYMTAIDIWGNESQASQTLDVTPDGTPPAIPTNLTAEAREESVFLTWDDLGEETNERYYIYFGTTTEAGSYYSNTSNNEIVVSNLDNDVQYFFKIRAYDNAENFGDYTDAITSTPTNVNPPTPHSLLVFEGNQNVTVNFNIERNIPDFEQYVLYMSQSMDPTTPVDTLTTQYSENSNSLKFDIPGLTNDLMYYFRVKTFDDTGLESEYSENVIGIPSDYRTTDSLALVAIYNALDGPNWNNQSNWLSLNPISSWAGVTMTGERVTSLDIYNRNLEGQIPPEIGDLTGLNYLRMGNDPIFDSVPSEIGNLKNLQTLYLYNNDLTSLPKTIGNLSNLRTFQIYGNEISSIPEEIGNLSKLYTFHIANNQLTTIPDQIGNLGELYELILTGNLISEFDFDMSGMTDLEYLEIGNMALSAFPSSVATAPDLKRLYIYGNNFNSIDFDFSTTPLLTQLHLESTNLTALPESISELNDLVNLYLRNNNLGTFPTEILTLSNLQYVDLSQNGLSQISEDLSGLSNLETLNLNDNNFIEVPTAVYDITNLERLELSRNQITSVDTNITSLINLRYLYLNNNQINTPIPHQLSQLTELYYLYLSHNQFTGNIPTTFGNLKKLYRLHLEHNQLDTPFPDEMVGMTDLRYFYIHHNQIPGNFPDNLYLMEDLDQFELNHNNLSGTFNPDVFNHLTLQTLRLNDNDFDSIPDLTGTPLDNNSQFYYFYFHNNRLGFNDIIPNLNLALYQNQYWNQKKFDEEKTVVLNEGESASLTIPNDHPDNTYQWLFNGSIIEGATNMTFEIDSITSQSAGIYTYQVRNTNAANLVLTSEDINVLVPDMNAPQIPQSFSVIPRNGAALLTWNSNNEPDFKHFLIYDASEAKNGGVLVDSTTNNTYTIDDLDNGSSYSYYVTSIDIWGNESNPTTTRIVMPDGTAPAIPVNLTAEVGEERIFLAWDHVDDDSEITYGIFYGTSAESLNFYNNTTNNNYTVTGLSNGVTYYFAILAADIAENQSDLSSIVSETPINTAPPIPFDLFVVEEPDQVTVTFNITETISDFLKYELYMGTEENPTNLIDSLKTQYSVNSGNNKFVVGDLENGEEYFFRIRTFDYTGFVSDYSDNVSGIPGDYFESDSLAVVAIYNAMNGENWNSKSGWLTETPLTDWNGIDVNNNRVTRLDLYNKNVIGQIPPDIGALTGVTYLRFAYDDVSDSIPSEIGNLKSLIDFQLYGNKITSIPKTIGKLKRLRYLELWSNQITSLPEEFGDLINLQRLRIQNNNISEIPSSLVNMASLTEINFSENEITEFDFDLSQVPNLTSIRLNSNNLSAFPETASSAPSLNNFEVSYNNIPSLSDDLSIFSNLQSFFIDGNPIAEIPTSISSLTNLITLSMNDMNLTAVPDEILTLTNLERLYLNNNNIVSFDQDLSPLTNLQNLYIQNNRLVAISDAITSLNSLRVLNLSGNDLTTINPNIGNLSNLRELYIQDNNIQDTIPASMGNLSELYQFYGYNNEITGGIPASFGNLTKLYRLYLYRNQLNKPFPNEIIGMTDLRYFEIYDNEIPGELPPNMDQMIDLDYLYIYNNRFSGTLDGNLADHEGLFRIYAENNHFDSIADFAGTNLDNVLQYLRIYNNELGFEELIKNVGVPSSSYQYRDQKLYGKAETILAIENDPLTLSIVPDDEDNVYQWYFNGDVIEGATETTFELDSVKPENGGIYTYRVTNSNLSDLTLTSKEIKVLVPDADAPSIPVGVSTQPRNGYALVNWNANQEEDLARYDIYLTNDEQKQEFLDSTTNTFYRLENLENGTSYSIEVVAVDVWGNESGRSESKIVTPDGTAPEAPTNVVGVGYEAALELTWDANAEEDVIKYFVYGSDDGGENFILLDSTSTNYLYIDDAQNGTEYFGKVTAIDQARNESDYSQTVSATPMNLEPPKIEGVAAIETNERIIFSWPQSQIGDFQRYDLYFDTLPDTETFYQSIYSSNTNDLELSNLVNGKTYYFSIKQIDDGGLESPISDEIDAIPNDYFANDSIAIVTLYDSLDGDNWNNNTGWKSDTVALTDWYGVEVEYGRVVRLEIQSNNLSGEIPAVIGDLTGLEHLDFYNMRNITGEIPEEIGNLKNLKNLYLRQLGLTGKVPASIGNLDKVTHFYIFNNYFADTLTAEIGDMASLIYLQLQGSQFRGEIPEEFGRMKHLKELHLNSNQLTGNIPDSLSNLESIDYLYLHYNQLTGTIPDGFADFRNIRRLYANNNQLSGDLPTHITSLQTLEYLNLQYNDYSGTIPDEYGDFSILRTLNVSFNDLTGELPVELSQLENLNELNVNSNDLTGTLPPEYGELDRLDYFYFQSNDFEGEIPDEYGNMSELYRFEISNNNVTGNIPTSFGNLTNLRYIYVTNNNLDSIPDYSDTPLDENRLQFFNVQNNKFEFNDIVPNVGVSNSSFNYSPQDSIGSSVDTVIFQGEDYTMIIETPGDSNKYQWYKDGSSIEDATDASFTISDFQKADIGTYEVRVTNSQAQGLTLFARPYHVDILKKPDVNISIFQNPGNTAYADIVFITDLELTDHTVEITEPNGTETDLETETISDYVRKAEFEFSTAGQHTVTTNAEATNGLDSTQVMQFNIAIAKTGLTNLVKTISNKAIIEFTKSDLTKPLFVMAEDLKIDEDKSYRFGPIIDVDENSHIEISYEEDEFEDLAKLFVYQKEGDIWKRLDSKVMVGEKRVVADIEKTGLFTLRIDPDFTGNNIIPDRYQLGQNYPNPFNPVTSIPVSIKRNTKVRIEIFNILGQRIKVLVNKSLDAGVYTFKWKGRNDRGHNVASGIYFYRIVTPKFIKTKKMMLIK